MKITKYAQSCLLFEIKGKRILVDPGNIDYLEEMYNNEWIDIDYILVTHKHDDHCNAEVINKIVARDNAKLYTSYEVVENQPIFGAQLVKPGDIIYIGDIEIGVVKAEHGFLAFMKDSNNIVNHNLGYIIKAEGKKIYITSDSISFDNSYSCDVICMPFNGNGLTFGIYDGILFAQMVKAKKIIPVHMNHPKLFMNPDKDVLKMKIQEAGMECIMLDTKESVEI